MSLSWQMLVVFKSAPILKRALKVKQAMMQLYVLKLLKIQTKYLGRQWRKSNMKTMSAIYQKVRHRMNDDWAYGNGEQSRGRILHAVAQSSCWVLGVFCPRTCWDPINLVGSALGFFFGGLKAPFSTIRRDTTA